jgi:glycosyltransferase involved in cell wall biosynthesis
MSHKKSGLKSPPAGINERELAFDGVHAPAHLPTVTLCMIVKNEEHNLSPCLQSVGDFATEIIIVDTGSTDGTAAAARAQGAVVRSFPWTDDFAAARNASIQGARGEWIFWMDADDRLSEDNLIRLKQAVSSGSADGYYCHISSLSSSQGQTTGSIEHLRLFRNNLGFCFKGALHEKPVSPSREGRLALAHTNITIIHTGYATDPVSRRQKALRNQRIVQKVLEREPDNLYWRHHLGVNLYLLGNYAGAVEQLELVMLNPPPELDEDFGLYQAYVCLMASYGRLKKTQKAEILIAAALKKYPRVKHLWITIGNYHLEQDEPQKAITALQRAREMPSDVSHGHRYPAGTLEKQLLWAHLLLGHLAQAKTAAQGLLSAARKPAKPLPLGLMEEARQLHRDARHDEAIQLLEPDGLGDPAALRLLAGASQNLGKWVEASFSLAMAIALDGVQAGDWLELAGLIYKAGNPAAAERFCRFSIQSESSTATAHNLLGIIKLEQNQALPAAGHFVQALLAAPGDEAATENLQEMAMASGIPAPEIIRHVCFSALQQKDYQLAMPALALLIEHSPRDSEAYRMLAVTLRACGREADALLCWKTAEELAVAQAA